MQNCYNTIERKRDIIKGNGRLKDRDNHETIYTNCNY